MHLTPGREAVKKTPKLSGLLIKFQSYLTIIANIELIDYHKFLWYVPALSFGMLL